MEVLERFVSRARSRTCRGTDGVLLFYPGWPLVEGSVALAVVSSGIPFTSE